MRALIPFILSALPAYAQDGCPVVAEHDEERAAIMQELRNSRDETEARFLSDRLWQIWTDAPDARSQALLDDGMERRMAYDYAGSREILDELVTYCPNYAEGFNQRAFAAFLAQDYAAALTDLDVALGIMPDHVAALSGKALTLIGMGRNDEAQEVLRAALKLNPWLSERALLIELPGQDI